MKLIEFTGCNVTFAKDQPEYQPMPALRLPDGDVITCWELEKQDWKNIRSNGGRIYLKLQTFNNDIQPQKILTDLSDDIKLTWDEETI